MEYSSVIFCLTFCVVEILTSAVDYPVGLYGVSGPELGPDGVYYETYGPDLAPYTGSFYEKEKEPETKKKYAYDYGVSDPHTGDHKKVWEVSDENGVRVRVNDRLKKTIFFPNGNFIFV